MPTESQRDIGERRATVYALIYDEYQQNNPWKRVVSIHSSRKEAENALEKRQKELRRRVWECFTRIVWVEKKVRTGDFVGPGDFDTWRAGEYIPEGELYSDSD